MEPLPIVYIAPIKTMTSPPGGKLFYCVEMFQFLTAAFHTILSFSMRLQASLDLVYMTLTSMSLSIIFIFYQNCYQFRTSSLTYVRGGAPYPSEYYFPLLGSASLLALGSGVCAPRGAPAIGLVIPAIFRRRWRFALGRSSSSTLPNSRLTKQQTFLIEPTAYEFLRYLAVPSA